MKYRKITLIILFLIISLVVLIAISYKLENKKYDIRETATIDPNSEITSQDTDSQKRTIVCFGDSIIGMHRDETSVTSYIASATGDIVYNVGFGGCRMAEHPYFGYNEFCMYALAKAITTNDFSVQDSAAADGSSYFQDQLDLLKSIDFNNVDVIVIHYGVNDMSGNVRIENPENRTDTSTFRGAMIYSIETITAAYPHIKIFVSLPTFHYRTDKSGAVVTSDEYINSIGNTLFDYISVIKSVANEYSLPVIDSYYGIGVDHTNADNYLADGIHHNEQGRRRLGEYIAYRLNSELNQ